MVAHEAPAQIPEKQTQPAEIPKSREIFAGDINDAVITVQKITGFEITPEWWMNEVGNEGATEDILDRFDTAFETFVHEQMGVIPEAVEPVPEKQPSAEADAEITTFDERFGEDPAVAPLREEFLEALDEHLKEKYLPDGKASESMEKDMIHFNLTTPESRRYSADESYRFLVHVPLGSVERRGNEIGAKRDGVLMTSLVNNEHQGTFQGYGCFLLTEPKEGSVMGISCIDVGAEVPAGRMDTIDSIVEPAPVWDYNQIDLQFDAVEATGVMIKYTPAGHELGNLMTNEQLREFAKSRGLPIVEMEVTPSKVPTEVFVGVELMPDEMGSMLTINLPHTEDDFYEIKVRRKGEDKEAYHAPGTDRYAGGSLINRYGEVNQRLSEEEKASILEAVKRIVIQEEKMLDPRVTRDDIVALERDLNNLLTRG